MENSCPGISKDKQDMLVPPRWIGINRPMMFCRGGQTTVFKLSVVPTMPPNNVYTLVILINYWGQFNTRTVVNSQTSMEYKLCEWNLIFSGGRSLITPRWSLFTDLLCSPHYSSPMRELTNDAVTNALAVWAGGWVSVRVSAVGTHEMSRNGGCRRWISYLKCDRFGFMHSFLRPPPPPPFPSSQFQLIWVSCE